MIGATLSCDCFRTMKGAPVCMIQGVPLRSRCENERSLRRVRWIIAIEFVTDFDNLGVRNSGHNETHKRYDDHMSL